MTSDITVIIPVINEIRHIERSVKSALSLTPYVFVVDSGSTDGCTEIAEKLGATVFQYEWTSASNFSTKMNWALQELPINTTWAIRLDADEYFMEDCIQHLEEELRKVPDDVYGITLIRRIFFLGRWMRHSGEYPKTSLRIYRVGKVEMENRWLDEHIDIKDGRSVDFKYNIVDDSKLTLSEWINKHNSYSDREVVELINQDLGIFCRNNKNFDKNANLKKRNKRLYSRAPKYWRCFFFFCYRYFFKLGILDGREGFLWNFFQCWWYRSLADAKMDELYSKCGMDLNKIREYIKMNYGLDINES